LVDIVKFNGKFVVEGDAAVMDSSAHGVVTSPEETGEVVDVATVEVLGVVVLVCDDGMEVAGKVATEELMLK
jgi:hypothetical protein